MTRAIASPRLVVALVAASGGATLTGEALGARALRPMLGSTAFANTGTLVGVLGALGLGAWYAGALLARGRVDARRVLVTAHLGLAAVAALGALSPWLLATPVARALVALSARSELVGDLARLGLAALVTAAPGALSGAVFPAAVALLGRGAGAGTATAGAASSLGAALASLAVTFAFGPTLGVTWTLCVVAAVYALLAAASARLALPSPAPAATAPDATSSDATSRAPVLAALALVGLASTAWQVLLARAGALAFGPSAFTFATALAGHVTALCLGELAALGLVSKRSPREARDALGLVTFAGALAACAGAWALAAMPGFAEALLVDGAPSQAALWSSAYGLLVVAALPAAACAGAAMPLAARALDAGSSRDGAVNGLVLAAAAAGNVVGALGCTFGAMPALGVTGAALAVGAALAIATAQRSRAMAVVAAGVVCLAALRASRVDDPAAMLRGPFLYAGRAGVELGRLAWRRDGAEATVAVRRDDEGNVLLQIDGKVDATSLGDATTQTVVGVVPVAMARAPRDVLVVGLGSGMTVDAARAVPGVRSVEVAELVGDVERAAREDFARANHHCLDDRRVRVLRSDAAQLLRGATRTWDVIVSEPSNPWVAGMSDLFTRESFEAARARLREGGTFGAWFHAYGTSAAVVSSIVATFRAVFPTGVLMEVTPGQDYLLVGFKEPARLDLAAFLERTRDPTVARILAAADIPDHAALLARFVGGTRGLAAIAGDAPVLRAADLTLEFRAPSLLYRDAAAEVFALLARVDDLPLAGTGLDASAGSAWLRALDDSERHREAVTHARALVLADRAGDFDRALREGELAVGLAPGNASLRAMLARLYLTRAAATRRRDPGAAEQDYTAVLELAPPGAERLRALVALGDLALRRRDGRRALARFEEASRIVRDSGERAPELRVRTAEALAAMGAPEQAAAELDRAIAETRDPRRRRELEALRRGER